MTEFDVQVTCPACGAQFALPRIRRGSSEPCPVCGREVHVPGASAYDEDRAEEGASPAPPPVSTAPEPEARAPRPTASTGRCFVCTIEEEKTNPLDAAPIVCEFTDAIPAEAKMQVVRGMGVLAREVEAKKADELVARLGGVGVEAFAMDHGLVPEVKRNLAVICVLEAADEGLQLQVDARGSVKRVGWDLVVGGFCTQLRAGGGGSDIEVHRTFKPVVAGGLAGVGVVQHTEYRKKRRPPAAGAVCTLLLEGRSGGFFTVRFTENEVRYSYQGKRRKPGGLEKFELLISDILRHCPHGFFPASTWSVAVGQRRRIARLRQEEDYRKYLRWFLCRLAYEWYGRDDAD